MINQEMDLSGFISDIQDFPKKGIAFKDITPLLNNPQAFSYTIKQMRDRWESKIDTIAGFDARGFVFGAALALEMKLPFVMLRKKGKLPGYTLSLKYGLEYGEAELELSTGLIPKNARVLLVDDLLATGGTSKAGCELVAIAGGKVAGCAFVIELESLGGQKVLDGIEVQSLITYKE